MGRRPQGTPPSYNRHKATGQAYSTVGGKRKYFGVHGTPAAFEAYQAFLADWQRSHGKKITPKAPRGTLAAAVGEFLDDVKPRYSATEWNDIRRDLDDLCRLHANKPPDHFKISHLKTVRQIWLDAGNHRSTVNRRVGRVRRFFRWCASNDFCRASTWQALTAILPVHKGEAPESPDVQPVPLRDLAATLRTLPEQIAAMVRIQYYAGCRPGEVCRMRGDEIFKAGAVRVAGVEIRVPAGVWLFLPGKFKTEKKHEKKRPAIYQLGPRCQRILEPLLAQCGDEFVFDPRRGPRKQRPRGVAPGPNYSTSGYYRVIERRCERYGIPHWYPHQLRHNFVSRVQATTGDLVATAEAVGHSSPNTTLIYLQRQVAAVGKLAAKIG